MSDVTLNSLQNYLSDISEVITGVSQLRDRMFGTVSTVELSPNATVSEIEQFIRTIDELIDQLDNDYRYLMDAENMLHDLLNTSMSNMSFSEAVQATTMSFTSHSYALSIELIMIDFQAMLRILHRKLQSIRARQSYRRSRPN